MWREGGGQKCRDAVRRIGVTVVSEEREMEDTESVYGGGRRRGRVEEEELGEPVSVSQFQLPPLGSR